MSVIGGPVSAAGCCGRGNWGCSNRWTAPDECECSLCRREEAHQGRDRRLGGRRRHGGACPGDLARPSSSRAPRPSSAARRTPCQPGRRRDARHAAGDQRECVAQAVRTGLGLKAKINLQQRLRPQELLLSRPAAGLSDLAIQAADRRRGRGRRRPCRRRDRHASASSGCTSSRTPASRCTTSTPTMSFVDLNRSGVALMEIVSRPDIRSSEEARAYLTKLRTHPPLPRHLRRRHGEGQPPRRRQRLGAPPGRAARHALRDQERQLDPLRRPGDRARGAPPDRYPRGWRHDRAGDAALRPGAGRDALDALQGGGARLPLFPRPRPPAARARPGLGRCACGRAARSCPTPRRRASSPTMASAPTMPTCSSPNARPPISSRRSPGAAMPSSPPTG